MNVFVEDLNASSCSDSTQTSRDVSLVLKFDLVPFSLVFINEFLHLFFVLPDSFLTVGLSLCADVIDLLLGELEVRHL